MWYKPNYVKKLALNSQLPTVQILTNDVQVLILCLSYFLTTVHFMFLNRSLGEELAVRDIFQYFNVC